MTEDNYRLRRLASSRLFLLVYQKNNQDKRHSYHPGGSFNSTERSFIRLSRLARERGIDMHEGLRVYNRIIKESKEDYRTKSIPIDRQMERR